MTQNNGDEHATRKKLELPLNQAVTAKILKEKPYEGENRYGKYFLWSFEVNGLEMVYFPDKASHEKLLALSLTIGDVILLTRTATQNGKKIVSQVAVDVILRSSNGHSAKQNEEGQQDDGLKDLMRRCVQDAVDIVKEVNSIPWQNEDVRSLSVTLFIQRVRG